MVLRCNDLRDLTANTMSEACKDTEIEPKLTPLSGEELQGRTSNNSKSLQQFRVMNEHEKKRAYNERILQIEHGTFIPLRFSINGIMGRECQNFYSRLEQMIAEKRNLPQSISSNYIRTKVCFGFLKSSLLCLRKSRKACRKTTEFEIDVDVFHTLANI